MRNIPIITDYIRQSLLTTDRDIVLRQGGVIARLGTRTMFKAYRSAVQTITASTYTKVEWNGEAFDETAEYDAVTNFRFTAARAGKYLIMSTATWATFLASADARILIYLNGAVYASKFCLNVSAQTFAMDIQAFMNLAVNDYVEIYVLQVTGAAKDITAGELYSWFCGYLLI